LQEHQSLFLLTHLISGSRCDLSGFSDSGTAGNHWPYGLFDVSHWTFDYCTHDHTCWVELVWCSGRLCRKTLGYLIFVSYADEIYLKQ